MSVVKEFDEHRKSATNQIEECLQNLNSMLDEEPEDYVLKEKIQFMTKLMELDKSDKLFYSISDCIEFALFTGAFMNSTGIEYNEFAHLAIINFINNEICPLSSSFVKRLFWLHHELPHVKIKTSGNSYLQKYPYYR